MAGPHSSSGLSGAARASSTRSSSSPTAECWTSRSGTPSGSSRRSVPLWVTLSGPATFAGSSRPERRLSSPPCRSSRSSSTPIGNEHRGRSFAIIIDEAHSSQGGRVAAAMSGALGEAGAEEEDETTEDRINRLMESRKLLSPTRATSPSPRRPRTRRWRYSETPIRSPMGKSDTFPSMPTP